MRCAIKRGLITDFETMMEYQYDEQLAKPVALCAKHTLEKRALTAATEDFPSDGSNYVEGSFV